MSREILSLKRREDGIFEFYEDGELTEEYDAQSDTWNGIIPVKMWRHFNHIIDKRIQEEHRRK